MAWWEQIARPCLRHGEDSVSAPITRCYLPAERSPGTRGPGCDPSCPVRWGTAAWEPLRIALPGSVPAVRNWCRVSVPRAPWAGAGMGTGRWPATALVRGCVLASVTGRWGAARAGGEQPGAVRPLDRAVAELDPATALPGAITSPHGHSVSLWAEETLRVAPVPKHRVWVSTVTSTERF